jgi:sporulation protein YabP
VAQHERLDHRVVVTNREDVLVEGVINVEKFDDLEIILETDMGILAIRGEELHIEQLSLEQGHLAVKGVIKTVDYIEDGGRVARGKGWFERFFR